MPICRWAFLFPSHIFMGNGGNMKKNSKKEEVKTSKEMLEFNKKFNKNLKKALAHQNFYDFLGKMEETKDDKKIKYAVDLIVLNYIKTTPGADKKIEKEIQEDIEKIGISKVKQLETLLVLFEENSMAESIFEKALKKAKAKEKLINKIIKDNEVLYNYYTNAPTELSKKYIELYLINNRALLDAVDEGREDIEDDEIYKQNEKEMQELRKQFGIKEWEWEIEGLCNHLKSIGGRMYHAYCSSQIYKLNQKNKD